MDISASKSFSDRRSLRQTMHGQSLYVLDEEFYPDVWKQDERMGVYMYTFRPKELNPEHYEQKMQFWKDMIEGYCDYKGSSTVTISELKEVFRRKGTSPYCLQTVFDQMTQEAKLINKQSFMEVPEKTWSGWALSMVTKPLSWGFGKLKEKLISASDDNTSFIVKSAVIRQARLLQKHIGSCHSYNSIISMDDVMKNADDIDGLSREGVLIALHYLSTVEKQVYMEDNIHADRQSHRQKHKLLMKFSEPHEKVVPITEMERSVYNLEQTEKFLISVIEEKEQQLTKVLNQAKECIKDGKKQLAKTHLRKKHLMEADITKSINILDNVQTMLQRVQNSKSDKDILMTYKIGSDAIKTAFAESGINLDKVDDIIEEMQEVFGDQDEITNVMSERIRRPNEPDDSELEKELMELMNANDEKDMKNNNAGNLPQDEKKPTMDDLTALDRELEMRLNRLRFDGSKLQEPEKLKSRGLKEI